MPIDRCSAVLAALPDEHDACDVQPIAEMHRGSATLYQGRCCASVSMHRVSPVAATPQVATC